MPKDSWDRMNSEKCVTPEERDQLTNYLGTPEGCFQDHQEPIKTNDETDFIEEKKAPPIINLLPNRSKPRRKLSRISIL